MEENTLVIKDMGDGYFKLKVTGGKVRDTRTDRTYRTVICKEHDIQYFEVA